MSPAIRFADHSFLLLVSQTASASTHNGPLPNFQLSIRRSQHRQPAIRVSLSRRLPGKLALHKVNGCRQQEPSVIARIHSEPWSTSICDTPAAVHQLHEPSLPSKPPLQISPSLLLTWTANRILLFAVLTTYLTSASNVHQPYISHNTLLPAFSAIITELHGHPSQTRQVHPCVFSGRTLPVQRGIYHPVQNRTLSSLPTPHPQLSACLALRRLFTMSIRCPPSTP